MPQTDESKQARELAAFTIELKEDPNLPPLFLTLPINPQNYTFSEPARSAVQQTLIDEYVEEWGYGVRQIALEGHTGFSVKRGVFGTEPMDGYQAFLILIDFMRRYQDRARANAIAKKPEEQKPIELILHIWEEDEHWHVVPNGQEALRRSRNSGSPLLFNYNLSFLAVRQVKVSDEANKLRALLLQAPDAGDLLDAVKGGIGFIDSLGAGLTKAFDDFNGAITKVKNAYTAAKNWMTGVGQLVGKVLGPIVSACRAAAAAIKNAIGFVRTVIKDVAGVIRFVRQCVHMFCALKHLGNYFANLFSPITSEWESLKRAVVRC